MNQCELWLLRHARAEPESPDGRDRSRQLHKAGRQVCYHLNRWLGQSTGLDLPERVVVSPAVRTRETAELALHGLDLPVEIDQRLWLASAEVLLEIAEYCLRDCSSLMMIGHNPGLEELIRHLGGALPVTGLKPGMLIVLRLPLPLSARSAQTLQVLEANESS